GGREVKVGSPRWLREEGLVFSAEAEATLAQWEGEGKSALAAVAEGTLLGLLALADALRPESREAVERLRGMGVEVHLLTGDNQRAARTIAGALGIDGVTAEVSPAGKVEAIRGLQARGLVVAMAGDGVNDAPALVQADVGVAFGTGADVAVEAADVALMRSDPRHVADLIALSRAVMTNIRQNLFWAFGYNVVLIPLAAGLFHPWGWGISPVWAAGAMGLSSVTVVSNALRLTRFPLGRAA
ncbi:MAG: HAD-IC family P-type ATPase, partial [Magnetococcales bacterium]|nr:HAD-IC family P-type ATPase [Magnetococcales bacterium]